MPDTRPLSSLSSNELDAGNAGIGLETVKELAKRGAVVIVGSRSIEKAEDAIRVLEQDLGEQSATLQLYFITNSSLLCSGAQGVLLLTKLSACLWGCM